MVFAGGVCYGSMLPLLPIAYSLGFNPASSMLIQNLFAAIILALISIIFVRKKIALQQALGLMGIGVFAYIMSATYFFALKYVSATVTIILMFQYVWMGIAIQAIVERQRPRLITLASGAIVIFGTVLTTGVFEEEISLNIIGVVLGLVSALAYAIFLFLSGRVATDVPTINRTAIVALARLILAIALVPIFTDSLSMPPAPILFGFGLLIALGGIIVPLLLIQGAAPHLPNSVTTIMSTSELPSAVILASLLLGEVITPLAWLGIVLVLGGIVLSQASELITLAKRIHK